MAHFCGGVCPLPIFKENKKTWVKQTHWKWSTIWQQVLTNKNLKGHMAYGYIWWTKISFWCLHFCNFHCCYCLRWLLSWFELLISLHCFTKLLYKTVSHEYRKIINMIINQYNNMYELAFVVDDQNFRNAWKSTAEATRSQKMAWIFVLFLFFVQHCSCLISLSSALQLHFLPYHSLSSS